MKLVKALILPVIEYGAEGWTLKKYDERRLEASEIWCYRRMLRTRTNTSIFDEHQKRRELLAQLIKIKIGLFGYASRNNSCNLVKTYYRNDAVEKKKGAPMMQ